MKIEQKIKDKMLNEEQIELIKTTLVSQMRSAFGGDKGNEEFFEGVVHIPIKMAEDLVKEVQMNIIQKYVFGGAVEKKAKKITKKIIKKKK